MKLKWIEPPPPASGKSKRINRKSDWLAAAAPGAAGKAAPPLVDGRWYFPIVRITCANVSTEGAVAGGYSGLFGEVGQKETRHVMDISITSPVLGNDGASDLVYGRQVVGALKTDDVSGSLSYAIARATMQLSKNSLKVRTNGLANSATGVLANMAGRTFTAESARNFGEGIGIALKWVVENAAVANANTAPAALYRVSAAYDEMLSVCFALGQIAGGNSLKKALETLGNYQVGSSTQERFAPVEPVIVAAVYHRFKVASTPTNSQKVRAEALLGGTGEVPETNKTQDSYFKAISPYVRGDGAIASLVHLAGSAPARVKAQPWPPGPGELGPPEVEIGNDDLSFQAALNIGLGILGDVHLGGDLRFCGFLAWSTYTRKGGADTMILNEHYGAGIRASIRYSGSEIKGGATQVAAKVTLEKAAASFSIDILGVDVGLLPSIGAFAGGAATVFDSQTLSLIGGLWSEANAVITAHDSPDQGIPAATKVAWRPCLTGVDLNLGADELQAIAGRCGPWAFALYHCGRGVSREVLLADATEGDYRNAVEKVYEDVIEPDRSKRNWAKELLSIGR
jgi:hypothetical protein